MSTTFEDAKIGDKVWSLTEGWGTIIDRFRSRAEYPLVVEFENREQKTYTLWGLLHYKDLNPTLFWDEIKIEAPQKPLPDLEVDAKVLVWDSKRELARTAHFCCFEDGKIYTYRSGRTSFTKVSRDHLDGWNYWEIAE